MCTYSPKYITDSSTCILKSVTDFRSSALAKWIRALSLIDEFGSSLAQRINETVTICLWIVIPRQLQFVFFSSEGLDISSTRICNRVCV